MNHHIEQSNNNLYEIEEKIRQMADELPKPQRELSVSPMMTTRRKKVHLWKMLGQAAMIMLSLLVFGGGTAFAANPVFRQTVIQFFTGGLKEEIPVEQLSREETEVTEMEPTKTEEFSPITVGNVTLLQNQKIDEHVTASYLFSTDYIDTALTPSGNQLLYTQETDSEERTYYQLIDGTLQVSFPERFSLEGHILLDDLPGVMAMHGNTEYGTMQLPEMTFMVDWQKHGEDIMLLNTNIRSFNIEDTFGGKADCEGSFYVQALQGDTTWVKVYFCFDEQSTGYQYPFLFNIHTGEIWDVLEKIDLSEYACITQLDISDDKKIATAFVGENHNELNKITIDLESGRVLDEVALPAPVSDCYISFTTSEDTVFYATGTEKKMNGYLYDAKNHVTKELFSDVAWGYTWAYGFADTYVQLIGGNYATYYKEPENEVYLLNLENGDMRLLEGIPASHDVSFFWNPNGSMLSISFYTELGASRLAFYDTVTERAWYFDRTLTEGVQEVSASWYGEYGYEIQAESEDGEQNYLYLYEFTP